MLWSPFPRSYFVACGLDNTCKVHCACYSEGTKVFIVIIAIQLAHSSWLLTYGHLANILSTHTQCSVQSLGRPLWKVFIPCVQREASHCTGCDWPGSCGSLLLGQTWNPFLICGSGVDVTVTSQTIYQLQREKMPGCAHTKVLTANSFLSLTVLEGSSSPWSSLLSDSDPLDYFGCDGYRSFPDHRCPFSSVGFILVPRHGTLGTETILSLDGANVHFISCGSRARNSWQNSWQHASYCALRWTMVTV